MALDKDIWWEVRPGTGSNTNGGGYLPGSTGDDFSQQDAPEYAISTAETDGSDTILTAAAAADMVGNVAYVAGGTGSITPGWYEILSVSAGVSITVDRSAGLTTGTGVTVNIGGALAGLVMPGTGSSADRWNIWLVGMLTLTATVVPKAFATIIGYGSARGDGTHATITTATNSTDLLNINGNNWSQVYRHIDFTTTASTEADGVNISAGNIYYLVFDDCTFDGFTYALDAGAPFVLAVELYHVLFLNCEIKNCTTHGMRMYNPRVRFVGCYIHDNSGDGVRVSGAGTGSVLTSGSVFYNNGANGIYCDTGGQGNQAVDIQCHNTAFVDNTESGVLLTGTYALMLTTVNCVYDSNGDKGIEMTVGPLNIPVASGRNNAFRNNTGGDRQGIEAFTGDITLSADPWSDKGSGDFTLNNTSGGGADLAAAGFQSTLIG